MTRVRVLVVDDSLFMRAALRRLLAADPRLEVVGEAKDGREAVERVVALQPDVVTMDVNMPVLDGVGAVREIMRTRPTAVVMLSAHTRTGAAETLMALDAGAVDFVAKPTGEVSAELGQAAPLLIEKIVAAAGSRPAAPGRSTPIAVPASSTRRPPVAVTPAPGGARLLPRVAVIAVSTGGPAALGRILPRLSARTPLALIVVQHMPEGFTGALAERLATICSVRVREAATGDHPTPGLVLVAPGDHHLDVAPDGSLVVLDATGTRGVRPAADVTLRGVARVYGRRSVGVVMTGMGRDGAEGLLAVKRAGGVTLAQDQASSVVWGMPRAAVELGAVDHVLSLDDLATALDRL